MQENNNNTVTINNKNYFFDQYAVVRRSDYIEYVNKLKPYEAMIKGNKDSNKDVNVKLDTECLEYIEKVQERIAQTQENMKIKLIGLFFNLSIEDRENLSFEAFEGLYNYIIAQKPNLLDFLYLPPIKGESVIL